MSFKEDDQRRWILVRATGSLTLVDVLQLIRTARATVEHQMWPMLLDARGATTDATDDDVARAVDAVRESVRTQGSRAHVALVADDDVVFARMLLYETKCAEIGVRVIRTFRQMTDAEGWLTVVSAARYFQQ